MERSGTGGPERSEGASRGSGDGMCRGVSAVIRFGHQEFLLTGRSIHECALGTQQELGGEPALVLKEREVTGPSGVTRRLRRIAMPSPEATKVRYAIIDAASFRRFTIQGKEVAGHDMLSCRGVVVIRHAGKDETFPDAWFSQEDRQWFQARDLNRFPILDKACGDVLASLPYEEALLFSMTSLTPPSPSLSENSTPRVPAEPPTVLKAIARTNCCTIARVAAGVKVISASESVEKNAGQYTQQDSNLQPSASEADALSN